MTDIQTNKKVREKKNPKLLSINIENILSLANASFGAISMNNMKVSHNNPPIPKFSYRFLYGGGDRKPHHDETECIHYYKRFT